MVGPEWATRLENTVLDASNRVSSRKGWSELTTTPATGNFQQLFEYYDGTQQRLLGVTSDLNLLTSVDGAVTWTDVSGTATISDPNMKLVEFHGVVIGFQNGDVPITFNGTTSTDLSPTDVPQNNVALSAFGRLWAKASATTLRYCALLDENTVDRRGYWHI